jgi:uncharacterized protein YndB with AHSA1/START domain
MRPAFSPVSASYEESIAAPADEIFDAWTTPEELKSWFGPGGFRTIEAVLDPRPGGTYRLVMRAPDGNDLTITGAYREVVRPSRLVYTWMWAHAPDQEMVVTVELRSVEAFRTTVRVTHSQIVDGELARYEGGWREGLARLRAVLAGNGRISDA